MKKGVCKYGIALLFVFYVLLFLTIYFFQQFDNRVFQHNYVIIGFFIMTLVFELFMYLSVHNAKRDTAKLLEEQHKKNNILLFVRRALGCFYIKEC